MTYAAPAQPPEARSSQSLVRAAYTRLRRDIIEGRLAPGVKLKVEHLKSSYGVGAGTLREALALLVSDALVETQDQRGFRVAPMSLEDFRDVTEMRVLLESEALRQSMKHGGDAWEGEVMAAYHRLSLAEKRLTAGDAASFDEWEARNREFHQALLSACPSRWNQHFLSMLYRQAERYRRLSITQRPIQRDVHDEHKQIVDAVLARDTDRATAILAQHIRVTFEAIRQLLQ